MKNNIGVIGLFLISISLICGCSGQRKAEVRNIVTNENTEADLGTVLEKDGLVHVNLVVRNETGDTIRPLRTYSYCRCTSAELDRTPVPPGENLIVPVTYNPAYKSGRFMEEIQVYYNDSHHLLSLMIKGDVIPAEHPVEEDYPYSFGDDIHLSHETLHFGLKKPGETGEIFIRIANESELPAEISFVPEENSQVGERSIRLAAKGRDTLYFHFRMPDNAAPGDTVWSGIRLYMNGEELIKKLNIKAIGK